MVRNVKFVFHCGVVLAISGCFGNEGGGISGDGRRISPPTAQGSSSEKNTAANQNASDQNGGEEEEVEEDFVALPNAEVIALKKSMAFGASLAQRCSGNIAPADVALCRLYILGKSSETVGAYLTEGSSLQLTLGQESQVVNEWEQVEELKVGEYELTFKTAQGTFSTDRKLVFYGFGVTLPESMSGDPLVHNLTLEKTGIQSKVRVTYSAGWTNNQHGSLVRLPFFARETNYLAPNEVNRPYQKIIRSSNDGSVVSARIGYPYLMYTSGPNHSHLSVVKSGNQYQVSGYIINSSNTGSTQIQYTGPVAIQHHADGSIASLLADKLYSFDPGTGFIE